MAMLPPPPEKIKFYNEELGKEGIWILVGGRAGKFEYMSLETGLRKLFSYEEAIRHEYRE
jgi:hypothetical protein